MKQHTRQWIVKAEEDVRSLRSLAATKPPPRDAVCFHCQQAVEKYLKALLQELGLVVPRTHNVKHLYDLLVLHDASLSSMRRSGGSLTKYAVEYRYPGILAKTRQMNAAIRIAERVRSELRTKLGLSP